MSCGRELKLNLYQKEELRASTPTTAETCSTNLMPTPLDLTLTDLKDGSGSLYIEFELKGLSSESVAQEDIIDTLLRDQAKDTVTNVLMSHYCSLKQSEKTAELRQFNSLVRLTIERKFAVRGAEQSDFEEFIALISSSLRDIDPHYEKIRQHGGGRFPKTIELLLGFNDPKKHKHVVKSINIETRATHHSFREKLHA